MAIYRLMVKGSPVVHIIYRLQNPKHLIAILFRLVDITKKYRNSANGNRKHSFMHCPQSHAILSIMHICQRCLRKSKSFTESHD
jgi:ribosomal protein S14